MKKVIKYIKYKFGIVSENDFLQNPDLVNYYFLKDAIKRRKPFLQNEYEVTIVYIKNFLILRNTLLVSSLGDDVTNRSEEKAELLLIEARNCLIEKLYPIVVSNQIEKITSVVIPSDLLSKVKEKSKHLIYTKSEIEQIIGLHPTSLIDFIHLFRHNLFRKTHQLLYIQLKFSNQIFSGETIFILVFHIVKYYNWSKALEYLQKLWEDCWILSPSIYFVLRENLIFCNYLSIDLPTDIKFEQFEKFLIEIDKHPPIEKIRVELELIINTIKRSLDKSEEVFTYSDWIFELYKILPLCYDISIVLRTMKISEIKESEIKQELNKTFRFYEELRVDIITAISDIGSVISIITDTISNSKSLFDAKYSLKYLSIGRSLIPKFLLETLLKRINQIPQWPIDDQQEKILKAEILEMINESLDDGFIEGYDIAYGKNHFKNIISSEDNFKRVISDIRFKNFSQFGSALIHAINRAYMVSTFSVCDPGSLLTRIEPINKKVKYIDIIHVKPFDIESVWIELSLSDYVKSSLPLKSILSDYDPQKDIKIKIFEQNILEVIKVLQFVKDYNYNVTSLKRVAFSIEQYGWIVELGFDNGILNRITPLLKEFTTENSMSNYELSYGLIIVSTTVINLGKNHIELFKPENVRIVLPGYMHHLFK